LWNSNSSISFWWRYWSFTGATEEYDGQLGQKSNWFKYSKRGLAGAGTQTAALAFGGIIHLLQEQQKNMTVLLGLQIQQV
jgi:hypothetical protein